jgi:hypothetical protein
MTTVDSPVTYTETNGEEGGCGTSSRAERLANELDRLSRPDRQGLGPELVTRLRVRIVDRWQQYAACAGADPEAWFPEHAGSGVHPAVVRTCAGCPVRRSCLASAVLWSVEGIWAGTTVWDRRTTLRLLRAGEPIAEVITATLDHAEGRTDRRRQIHGRDWFHTDPRSRAETVAPTAAETAAGTDRDSSSGQERPGAAA